MGRFAQAVGESFEAEIQARGETVDGLVLVKQHPEVKFVGKGKATVRGKAWADYIAMYKGHSLTFDAKSTANKEYLKAPEDRRHQFEKLKWADRYSGTPSFYLVEWREYEIVSAHMVYWESKWPFKMYKDKSDYWATSQNPKWLEIILSDILYQERSTIQKYEHLYTQTTQNSG